VVTQRRPVKILHTADVHLDCDSYGRGEQGQAYRSLLRRYFQSVVDLARDETVDLLLIAGDLFDHNRVPDETVAFVQDELRRLQQPVVILPGNHDCLYPNAIYDRHDFSAACDNVKVITELNGQTIALPELDVVVWGRAMEEHEPGFHPLAHIPTRTNRRWHIAMAHGFFYDTQQIADRSSPIFAEEIRDTGWDYIAMGHQHVLADKSQGNVTAYYPGATFLHWNEAQPDGCVLLLDCTPERGIVVQPRRLLAPAQ
jgi:DNA repair exonuclease SbcCD nuclease subunit